MLRAGTEDGTTNEASLLEALQARHRLRTLLKKRQSYLSMNPPVASLFANTTALQSCSAVNFVVGEHFNEGATSWRDLKWEARNLLQPIVNGSAHLVHAKPSDDEMPMCENRIVVETLVTPTLRDLPNPNPAVLIPLRERVYRVTGYRLWSLTACTKHFFDEYLQNRNTAVKDRRKRQNKEDAAPERATKKRRLDDGAQEVAPPPVPVPLAANTEILFSPLAIGLEASFRDAKALHKRIRAVREKEEARRAARKPNSRAPVIAPESQPLVLQNVDVGNMMPFQYANATSVEEFHWMSVVKYTRPNHYAFASAARGALTKGQIVDPRPHLAYSTQDEVDRFTPYMNREHVLNPDVIFSMEAAMVYHTRNPTDGKRRVCSRQTNLGNYTRGAPPAHPPFPVILNDS